MAIKNCKDCGKQVSNYAKTCPHCGRPLQSSGCMNALLVLIVLFFSLLLIGYVLTIPNDPSPTITSNEPIKRIPYQLVEASSITQTDRIVISPDNFNEKDMVALGETLKNDLANETGVVRIYVFDDLESAKYLTQARRNAYAFGSLDDHSLDGYYKHHIATYAKNTNTGYHQYTIFWEGSLGDKQKDISY